MLCLLNVWESSKPVGCLSVNSPSLGQEFGGGGPEIKVPSRINRQERLQPQNTSARKNTIALALVPK